MADSNKDKSRKSRRKFLVNGGLTIGVLTLGTVVFRNPLRRKTYQLVEDIIPPYVGSGTKANLWFEITKDNKILLHSPKVEMGQGTFTGLAQLAAEELEVELEQIEVVAAQSDTGVVDQMGTGGSLSIATLYTPLRELAATMREMIKLEAAKQLDVPYESMQSKNAMITVGDKTISFADIAAKVKDWEIPKTPKLKAVSEFKYIGKPLHRIDQVAKIKGDPIFGLDATMPNMLYGTVLRAEHIGATIKSIDTAEAEKMPGVVKITDQGDWVGVIAESFTQALQAKEMINVEWDIPKEWSEEALRDLLQVGNGSKMILQKNGSKIEAEDENIMELEFTSPIGAHAQIEPNCAVAHVENEKITVKLATQVVGQTQRQVAKELGVAKKNVNIIPTYLGGGFGRRLNTDHAVQAAIMSKVVSRPVKYVFTRKEEFQNDQFRPPTHHIVKGKLDDQNKLHSIEHHYASGDVSFNSALVPNPINSALGTDVGAMRGGNVMYDGVPNIRAVQWHTSLPFATSFWRSLGLLANTFAIESFIDEMSIKANRNPVEFRLEMISDRRNGKRLKEVIREAANRSGFTTETSGNRAMGFAASIDVGTPCAQVVEVVVEDNHIKVEKVTCVMDCGLAVNPDQVRAQCEGSIIMGLSASKHEQMTIRDGQLYPIIYGPYDMAKMKDSPKEIDVYLIQGVDEPMPVGEPPIGPIGAAIANAVRRITGQRLTHLPLRLS